MIRALQGAVIRLSMGFRLLHWSYDKLGGDNENNLSKKFVNQTYYEVM